MANPIVKVNASQVKAPTPSVLQKTGAIVSVGGTNLAVNGKGLLTQPSDLTPFLQSPIPLLSLSQSAGVATATLEGAPADILSGTYNSTTGLVTLTLSASIGAEPGEPVLISNASGSGSFASINGTWPAAAGTTGSTLTFFIATGLTMTIAGGEAQSTLGPAIGATFLTTIAGAVPAAYNGSFIATVATATTFTYAVPSATSSPATGTPIFTPPGENELLEQATTFFAQGSGQAAYVLELGPVSTAAAITALGAYIAANPNTVANIPGQLPNAFYSYLVPRAWDGVSSFITLANEFTAVTSKLYFFVTTTLANYALYAAIKSVFALIEAPGVQTTEFSCAAPFWVTLNYAPSSTNRVTPLNFAYLVGVTPYPAAGNAALLSTLNAANVNIVSTGAQGGISNILLYGGNMMDGNPFNYWYAADWAQINGQINLTAACINGSNNPQNPLYYNQFGINTLQQVLVSTMNQGISYGLILNPVKATTLDAADFQTGLNAGTYAAFTQVNADPFATYVVENPNDYGTGTYNGLAVDMVPLRGFESITFNLTVSNFAG